MEKETMTVVVKNSWWARQILHNNHFLNSNHRFAVSADTDNDEYLVFGIMNPDWGPCLQYYSVDADFYTRYLTDNIYCPYVHTVIEFIEMIKKFNHIIETDYECLNREYD